MTGVSTNGLARPPVAAQAATVSASSKTTSTRRRGDEFGLQLVDGLDPGEHHERDRGEREVVVLLAEEAEDDAGEDRHPARRDRQPDEAVLDAGRGRVARRQRGRQAADSF